MLGEPGVWATTGGAGKVLWDFVKACFFALCETRACTHC